MTRRQMAKLVRYVRRLGGHPCVCSFPPWARAQLRAWRDGSSYAECAGRADRVLSMLMSELAVMPGRRP